MDFIIYLVCLVVGLVFTLLTAFFGHIFGGGHEGHVDGSGGHAEAGADASDMPGVSALSPTVITSFITAFGGFGIIFHEVPATKSPFLSAPLAVVGAVATAGSVLWVLRQLFTRTQSSSESKVGTLIGMEAHIITPIPENGVGEIAYVQGGTRYTAPAREETGMAVASGKPVRIVRIVGSQFYVACL
ncbi:MAG TPA: NfeD family protein, partial [Verrucomicrobiae bacterium]|nr:NfeD family protein [Verrucomicrobiae bacterium]